MKSIFLVLFLLVNTLLLAQMDELSKDNTYRVKYYQDFLNFAGNNPNESRVDAFIQVPYKEMQFIISNKGYSASYTVVISIYDSLKEKLISEKTFNEEVNTAQFDNTIGKANFNISLRSFYLRPGSYIIRTEVEDKESKSPVSTENKLLVKSFNRDFALSDIMLILSKDNISGSNKMIPNITRNVVSQKTGVPIFYEVYSKKDSNIILSYKVYTEANKLLYQELQNKKLDTGKTQIFYTIRDSSFSLGKYMLLIELSDKNGKMLANTSKVFYSRWGNIPENIKDLDKAISQLVYIATDKELGYIKDAPDNNTKLQRYKDFWKSKDPVPSTEDNEVFDEYYRRIAYANEHFGGYTEGWRTDRGMVYIILGSPSNIDRHPYEIDSKPYEVWDYYNLNRQYIFMDESGFGNYRLITPFTGDDYRYR